MTKTDKGSTTKKAGNSPKKTTCVYEKKYVHMKGASSLQIGRLNLNWAP